MGEFINWSFKKKCGDSPEENFVTAVSVALVAACVFYAVAMNAWSAIANWWTHMILTNTKIGIVAVYGILNLLHLRYLGLTLHFKLLSSVALFCIVILLSVTGRRYDSYHLLMVLVLDLVLILRSEEDSLVMGRLSTAFVVGFVLYCFLYNLSLSGLGPDIHPVDYELEFDVYSNMFLHIVPVVLNFGLVRSYGRDLRSEARRNMISVQAASDVGRALVDFDLDKAHNLMACMEADSPIFEPLMNLIHNLRTYRPYLPAYLFSQAPDSECAPTNKIIAEAMSGMSTSWSHARIAIERLRDPEYSLNDFHSDMEVAFPELQLYHLESDGSRCSSGRTGAEEYQRTLGALYSVYCIARLDMDGKEVFSFGVDVNGKPVTATSGGYAEEKRAFYRSMDWKRVLELFERADLLRVASKGDKLITKRTSASASRTLTPTRRMSAQRSRNSVRHVDTRQSVSTQNSNGTSVVSFPTLRSTESSFRVHSSLHHQDSIASSQPEDWNLRIEVNVERMTAFLALTAIHDIMKNPYLLMTVHKKHAPYQGIAEGCLIHDHDLALRYIMEHFPMLLPSFQGLGPGQRATVFFSQGKMGFNNGWLVQGEAPPGALFSTFKEVITLGGASESDIGFYFAHWLTDLAGAEPFGARPWPGSEKFALKFPLKVLRAFLDSFGYVGRLNCASEVEVMEEYLHSRWLALDIPDAAVSEDCAVASKRLALMAQGFELAVVAALKFLPTVDRDLLAAELARTGLQEQFASGPADVCRRPAGPALLVYYAPALIQKAGADQASGALHVLAAVCRAARQLFPLGTSPRAVESTVVIRIEALKVLTPTEIDAAGPWFLRRLSPDDAVAARCEPENAGDIGTDAALIKLPESGLASSSPTAGVFPIQETDANDEEEP